MPIQVTEYARGTYLTTRGPWGLFLGGRVECADGKVRTLARIAQTADTFFSVPAAVKVGGRTVAGYVTFETVEGWSTETDGDPRIARFVACTYRKNHALLPDWPNEGVWPRANALEKVQV